jgi:hypothetical protein
MSTPLVPQLSLLNTYTHYLHCRRSSLLVAPASPHSGCPVLSCPVPPRDTLPSSPTPILRHPVNPAWVHLTTMKSSGVSRFLSRRDKHHEKRSSKTAPGKVCLPSCASCTSLTPLLHSPPSQLCGHRRHSQSLEALYHKLPCTLRTSVEDGFSFFQRNALSRASFNSTIAPNKAHHSSDHLPLQSRPENHVSPDLYKIFTDQDSQTAVDKDADKKVRRQPTTNRWLAG